MVFYSGVVRVLFLYASLSITTLLLLSIGLAERPRGPGFLLPQTRPLDPLTPEEKELAARIASTDTRVKKELGSGRQQLIQVQFLALKAGSDTKALEEQEPLKPGRYAAVLFYRYDTDQAIHVVVDVSERSVANITRLEGRAVPLAPEEVARAFALALLNSQVRALLGPQANELRVAGLSRGAGPQNRVEGLRVIATSTRDPCYRHRCVELHFRKRDGYVPGISVTVDLSAQKVKIQNSPK
jgi:hypothetical protein